ncbi:MAG: uncharacterized protein QOF68_3304 [Gaiellales bacterium]|jgi:hypothetical protein|nr:uncharacterized protein [Gaiellales bacterium]
MVCRLYTMHNGHLYHADIHHVPWPLQPAKCQVQTATIAPREPWDRLAEPPLCHYAGRQDVLVWPLAPTT